MKPKIFVGMVRERLTVVSLSTRTSANGSVYWNCSCSCGGTTTVRSDSFLDGRPNKSCGCYLLERNISNATHKQSRTRTYHCWSMMKQRCLNPKVKFYPHYGGRGIAVCPEWMVFENFYADMGEMPVGLSLDRIDPNGNYCKENCRWATSKEQNNNKRELPFLDIEGVPTTMGDYIQATGRTTHAVYNDVYRGKLKRYTPVWGDK